jgi:Galactose oxidase, central domain
MALSVASDVQSTPTSPGNRQSVVSVQSTPKNSLPRSARRLLSNIRFSTILTSTHSTPVLPSLNSTPTPDLIAPPSKPSKPRAKHIPIVIPYHACSFLPSSPLSLTSDYASSVIDFPAIPTSVTQPLSKPGVRYVEIKIPDFITCKYLPPSPKNSEFSTGPKDSEPRNSLKGKDSIRDSVSTSSGIVRVESIIEQDKEEKDRKDSGVYTGMAYPLTLNTRAQPNGTPGISSSPSRNQPNNMMGPNAIASAKANTQPQLYRLNTQDMTPEGNPQVRTPASAFQNMSAGPSPAAPQGPGVAPNTSANIGLSGFVCNVHRTTGREPKPLVGATTTIVGDKLYVFGGRRISRAKTQLTSDLYELDLIRRNWTKVDCKGDVPPQRYFHSVCALGDTKLVCYGGMSQSNLQNGNAAANQSSHQDAQSAQNSMDVMSDVHIFDIPSKTWMKINSTNSPQGRYAHCATILPSSAVFSSPKATLSAIQHNPSSAETPNQGKLGVSLDGSGGAEMVIVGGQDSTNHYIEQISVFNLRSLTWTSTSPLGRQCGAYRSVTAPLSASVASQIGVGGNPNQDMDKADKPLDGGSAMLIYSNYNFLDVKLELQIHLPDGTLVEKPMHGGNSPPGLRFPNGGVIDNHFVVSGTFLTSYKQEYALWALDLRTLLWNRIDIGSSIFSQGSWNRGVLWQRRNAFVILGNRKRSLVEDYNHRRVNFSNICVVELEAFGLYDNPRRMGPMSGYISASSSLLGSLTSTSVTETTTSVSSKNDASDRFGCGRELSRSGEELGRMVLGSPELADMDFLAINGERIPINSRLVARRWGPYFIAVMREAVAGAEGNDTSTLRPSVISSAQSSRNSSITITPSLKSAGNDSLATSATYAASENPENAINPANRPRTLYLPHTPLTIHALLNFLYTSSLPPPSSHLCTPQILCSLLQIARPYKIDGLLEAVVERLHAVLDNRNTAAIFNAAAMAAGGGDGVEFVEDAERASVRADRKRTVQTSRAESPLLGEDGPSQPERAAGASRKATNTGADGNPTTPNPNDASKDTEQTSPSNSAAEASEDDSERRRDEDPRTEEIWSGSLSAVVGLQKRGLRGLMEGRRIREMGSRDTAATGGSGGSGDRVGLGIEKA